MADDKKSLKDIIQGLIDTDRGVISKLKGSLNSLNEKVERGSGSYALVDINTPDRSGDGVLENDIEASNGQCISLTTSSNASYCLYSGTLSDIKFGNYALCVRAKSDSLTGADVVQLKILNGTTEILSKNFKGSDFENTSSYQYLYTTFTYDSVGTAKQALSFQLHTRQADGIKIKFDYAYVSMIIPSVYI